MIKIEHNKLLLLAVFFIFPIFSLPLIFIEIYNRKYYALFFLSLLIAAYSFLFAPFGDLARYQFEYDECRHLSFVDLFEVFKFDFLNTIFNYIFSHLGIKFEWIRFFYTFISCQIFFSIYVDAIHKTTNFNKRYSFGIFITFLLLIPFQYFTSGLRFPFALSLIIGAIYFVLVRRQKKYYWLALASILVHFSMLPIFIILLLVDLNYLKEINPVFLGAISIIMVLFSIVVFDILLNVLPISLEMKEHLSFYITGYWASEYLKDRSFLYKVFAFLNNFLAYPIAFYFLFYLKKYLNKYIPLYIFLEYFLIFLALVFSYQSVFGRYVHLFKILPFVLFLLCYVYNKKFRRVFFGLLFLVLMIFPTVIYYNRRTYVFSMHERFLYCSFPFLFTSHFDRDWQNKYLNYDGSCKIND